MITDNLKLLIQRLNPLCQAKLEEAVAHCLGLHHHTVEIAHWLFCLLQDEQLDISLILNKLAINCDNVQTTLQHWLANYPTGNTQAPAFSLPLIAWTQKAWLNILPEEKQLIGSKDLLLALIQEPSLIEQELYQLFKAITVEQIDSAFKSIGSARKERAPAATIAALPEATKNTLPEATTALNLYTINLTALAKAGKIDQVLGRDAEIRQMIDILMRRRQNNPILTGEPGVGKTAIVEGLALRIATGQVPTALQTVAVHTLDLALLQAGAGVKGEFEQRLKAIIHEVQHATHPIILFIDEAHTLIGAGAQAGQGDAANLLKPALARGELRTIAATTWAEYKQFFEQDAALTRRFQVINIAEPSAQQAISMLQGLVPRLEQHHQVTILASAVDAAVHLSQRYLVERQLPDKAISVLDTACARLALGAGTQPAALEKLEQDLMQLQRRFALLKREHDCGIDHREQLQALTQQQQQLTKSHAALSARWEREKMLVKQITSLQNQLIHDALIAKDRKKLQKHLRRCQRQLHHLQGEAPFIQASIDAQSIANVIATWTGIPVGKMLRDDIQAVLKLQERLQHQVLGQDHALKLIAECIQTTRANLTDPNKPIACLLLVGPSGVGKTATAHALAEALYGSEQQLTVINLSEFKEQHKVSLLLGSPPGYIGYGKGGILTEAVRQKPYSLILLDELEKAHPEVQDIFYQLFDKGQLRDGQGRDVCFKNTIIILTANVGSELISRLGGHSTHLLDLQPLLTALQAELLNYFKPAFLGRLKVIPYLSLSDHQVKQIADLQLKRLAARLQQHYQADFSYSPDVIHYLNHTCQTSSSGVRHLEQMIAQQVLPGLAEQCLLALAEAKAIQKIHLDINSQQHFTYQLTY